MALQLEGGGSSLAPAQTPNLVGEVLGRARTPRWLGDPYGVDEQGAQMMGPDRVSLPNIVARSRSDSSARICLSLVYFWTDLFAWARQTACAVLQQDTCQASWPKDLILLLCDASPC